MKNNGLLPFIALLGIMLPAVSSAKPEPPTTNTTYVGQMPGGRAMAMGYAFTSIAGDPADIYFNPAGLAFYEKSSLSISYEAVRQSELKTEQIFGNEMLKNRNLIFLALVAPKGSFSWRPLADSVWRTSSGQDWSATEYKANMYTLSAGHKYGDTFCSGINLSYLAGQIAQSSVVSGTPSSNLADAYGISSDVGFLITPSEQFHIGLNLQNLLGFMWWDDFEAEQLPLIVRTGFSFRVSGLFTFATDWEKRYYRKAGDEASNLVHFGLEQNIGKVLQLRAGTYGEDLNDKETVRVTAGFGYKINDYSVSLSGEKYRLDQKDVFRYLFSLDLPLDTKI